MNQCPKCQSTEWDWANIGFTDVVLCTNCGNLYPSTEDGLERVARERERSYRWPFPSYPPIPWDKKQQEEYERNQRNQLPQAPM